VVDGLGGFGDGLLRVGEPFPQLHRAPLLLLQHRARRVLLRGAPGGGCGGGCGGGGQVCPRRGVGVGQVVLQLVQVLLLLTDRLLVLVLQQVHLGDAVVEDSRGCFGFEERDAPVAVRLHQEQRPFFLRRCPGEVGQERRTRSSRWAGQ